MPRKAQQKTEPAAMPAEATPAAPSVSKPQAVRVALIANPEKSPKEIVAWLKAQGLEATSAYVSGIKFHMAQKAQGQRKQKAAAAPAPEATGPAVPKDAVSLWLLQKAKKLAAQFSNIQEAKQAMDALAQILD